MTFNNSPRVRERYSSERLIAIANAVTDWHLVDMGRSMEMEETFAGHGIISRRKDCAYNGEAGKYRVQVTQRTITDAVPKRKAVSLEETYLLHVKNGEMDEVVSSPKEEIRRVYLQAQRKGSRTSSFRQEVA